MNANGYGVLFGADENVLKLDSGDSKSVNTLKTTLKYFKRVNFVLCELYINRAVIKNNNPKAPLIMLSKLLLISDNFHSKKATLLT